MRIAHLSDPHILEPEAQLSRRPLLEHVRLNYLSLLRPLDAAGRLLRLSRAIAAAQAGSFDHLVISGDLTEDGTPPQFEELAKVLADSGVAPEHVTLVPGNHDAYGNYRGWRTALEGPLAPYAATSSGGPRPVVDLGGVVLLP